jgi:hypothetical protein
VATILTREQVREYRQKGYLILQRVFDVGSVNAWRTECDRLLRLGLEDEHNLRTIIRPDLSGKKLVERFDPVLDLSPVFKRLSKEERILGPLRELYQDDMLLFKDKIIFKLPGAPGYPMHQDYSWWQGFPRDLVNVLISIDGSDATNGAIEIISGYHNRLLSTPGELRQMSDDEAKQIEPNHAEVIRAQPGDVLIFDCLTPHRSGPNESNRSRRHLYLTYSAGKYGDLYQAQFEYYMQTYLARSSDTTKHLLFFR